MHITLVDLVL